MSYTLPSYIRLERLRDNIEILRERGCAVEVRRAERELETLTKRVEQENRGE